MILESIANNSLQYVAIAIICTALDRDALALIGRFRVEVTWPTHPHNLTRLPALSSSALKMSAVQEKFNEFEIGKDLKIEAPPVKAEVS